MENPTITIITDDELEKDILEMYWQPNGNRFKINHEDVLNHFQIKRLYLSELAKDKSLFELFCDECGKLITSCNLRYHINLYNHFYKDAYYCSVCLNAAKQIAIQDLTPEEVITQALKTAIDRELWKALNFDCLETLFIIVQSESKGQIMKTLFSRMSQNSVWYCINKLEYLKLIYVKRRTDKSIESFDIHGYLYNKLATEYPNRFEPLYEEYQDPFGDGNIDAMVEKVGDLWKIK